MVDDTLRRQVREQYGRRARSCGSGCCGTASSSQVRSQAIGYSKRELQAIPQGANLGLGCGNPTALASLHEGEIVLDLGSGAGIDCFLAAQAVGSSGQAIGVDMTPDMIDRARDNAREHGIANVEFRLGEIEHLPAADSSVDVVISNCVINLSIDKPQVFREAYRALRPGGRMYVSDIVLLADLPSDIRNSIEAYVECVAGAVHKAEYLEAIRSAGFDDIEILSEIPADSALDPADAPKIVVDGVEMDPCRLGIAPESVSEVRHAIASINVRAVKAR